MANNLIDKSGKLNTENYRKKIEKQQETFAKIDATMAILEKMPDMVDNGFDFNFSMNPMGFLISILKSIGVEEDELRKWIVDILVNVLPAVEVGVKGFLLSRIKSIISCNFDPRIPWELRKKAGDTVYADLLRGSFGERGFDIPLSAIDPEGMLDLSPFTEPGQDYYFGQSKDINEDSNSKVAKLARADDFNAFLWYVIHRGNRQNPIAVEISDGTFEYGGKTYTANTESMKGVVELTCSEGDEFIVGTTFCDKESPKEVLICIEKEKGKNLLVPLSADWQSCNWYVDKSQYYNNNIKGRDYENDTNPRNYEKEKPICNLMYGNLDNYKNTNIKSKQIGLDNIRFTILPKPAVILPSIEGTIKEPKINWRVTRLLFDAEGNPDNKGKYSLPGEFKPRSASQEGSEFVNYFFGDAVVEYNTKTGEYKSVDPKYLIECYPGLTVYEFNYDYVMGMKLFDAKVVCKKLLSSATNCRFNANFRLSFNKQKNRSNYPFISGKLKILELVRKIVETDDDDEINDCFYSFSNDEYDELLLKTAELKYNQSPYTEGYGDGQVIDLSSVDVILNDFNENGTIEEQKKVINKAIEQACYVIEDSLLNEYDSKKSSIKISFLTNLFQQLALCLIDCILSPKILMLLIVNDLLMRENDGAPITIEQLMSMAKNIITGVIKEARNLIMQKILDYIIEFITPLVIEIKTFIASEQFASYMAIMRLLMNWYYKGVITLSRLNAILSALFSKLKRNNYDDDSGINYDIPSILDNVDYADILYNDLKEKEPIINNCNNT